MIGDDDARRLRRLLEERGRPWEAGAGDRFRVPDRDLDDAVCALAGMTIDGVTKLAF